MNQRIIGLVFIAVPLLVLHFFIWPDFQTAQSTTDWPSVDGQIMSSYLSEEVDRDGKTKYKPEVKYEYTVDGQSYLSYQILWGSHKTSYSWILKLYAQGIVDEYPKGKTTVFYNPDKPSQAVLKQGVTTMLWVMLCGLVLTILAGVKVLIGRQAG